MFQKFKHLCRGDIETGNIMDECYLLVYTCVLSEIPAVSKAYKLLRLVLTNNQTQQGIRSIVGSVLPIAGSGDKRAH